jgi:hypothetical protein
MIERDESGQASDSKVGGPGTYLKAVNEDTDVDPSEIKDESDGMPMNDFLGRSNLRNRNEESDENA